MAEITLNYQDSMRILHNAEADPDARVMAAAAIAFFEMEDHADDASGDARGAALKLLHMSASAIYRNGGEVRS